MNQATAVEHSKASRFVASFRNKAKWNNEAKLQTESFGLQFQSKFYDVQVWFTSVENMEDFVWVRSRNWRCEDEPCGLMPIREARAFYKQLVDLGFSKL